MIELSDRTWPLTLSASTLCLQAPDELRPRALLLAVCGVESLTCGTASLELPSKNTLNDEAVELVTLLAVCGNDTTDVYPRVIYTLPVELFCKYAD